MKFDLQFFGGRGSGSYSGSAHFTGGGNGGGYGEDLNVAGWTPEAGSKSVSGATTLNSVENRIKGLDHEQMVVVDKNGYVVAVVDGAESSVSHTARSLKAVREGGTLTHNHPNGGTFSGTDIITAGRTGAAEIRAVSKTTGKSYSLKAGTHANGLGLSNAMRKSENKLLKQANKILDSTVNKRKYKSKDTYMKAVDKVWDDVMGGWLDKNASKYGYSYSSNKTGSYK